jgi:hypothetical protein
MDTQNYVLTAFILDALDQRTLLKKKTEEYVRRAANTQTRQWFTLGMGYLHQWSRLGCPCDPVKANRKAERWRMWWTGVVEERVEGRVGMIRA